MKTFLPVRFLSVLSVISVLGSLTVTGFAAPLDWGSFLSRNDPTWNTVPAHWTKGPFVGNGDLGAMIYHEPTNENWVRMELSRSDLYTRPGLGGIRVPTGHLYLKPVGKVKAVSYRVNLYDAEANGTLTTEKGQVKWRAFVHAAHPLYIFEYEGTGEEGKAVCEYVADRARNTRNEFKKQPFGTNDIHPEPVWKMDGGTGVSWQPFNNGGGAATAVRQTTSGATTRVVVSLAVGWTDDSPAKVARKWVEGNEAKDMTSLVESHRAWWHGFYPASFLSIPDARLESFYWLQLYKMASATRADRTPVDLMGPWYQPSGWLAFWMNLNIQLAYWPVYAANHLELGESLSRWVTKYQANLVSNAPADWQGDSAALGRVTGLDLRGNAGEELGNLPFLLHNIYWQYRYSMDDKLLRGTLIPLLTRSVNFYRHKMVKKEDGKWHLPLAVSPEYEQKAEDCNYDLSLLRWACGILIENAEKTRTTEPLLPVWKDILANLTPYPQDETGLNIGAKVPLAHSHRHFSHLFMIFPLATMKFEGEDRALVEKSIKHWLDMTGAHAGYSYTGGAAMAAYLGDGDRALGLLDTFCDKYVKANTFYTESAYWPVIETPLAGARSIQEMLLQSWGNTLRVFPGVPKSWTNAAFENLRGEGAFLVSAVRRDGRTRWLKVESLAGEPCRVKTDLKDFTVKGNKPHVVSSMPDGSLLIPLAKGDWVQLVEKGWNDLSMAPVPRYGMDNAWGTVKAMPKPPIQPGTDGVIHLMASNAQLSGAAGLLSYFKDKTRDTLDRWTSDKDYPVWKVAIPKSGTYMVNARYGHPGGGSAFIVEVGGEKVEGMIQKTGDFEKPEDFEVGTVSIKAPGTMDVKMLATKLVGGAVCNLREITLTPVK